ncbi:MAG: hypothetical protein ACREFN_13765 [Acetobacteraceae bacterium]
MSRLNDPKNFSGRVAYAAATIAAGRQTSHTFDNCFENHDGDEVSTVVYRRSIRNPKIAANIWRYLDREVVIGAATRLSSVPTREMPRVAAESRARKEREFEEGMRRRQQGSQP